MSLGCMNCGAEIDDDDDVCPECGEDVSPEVNTQEFWECDVCGGDNGEHLDHCHSCGSARSD